MDNNIFTQSNSKLLNVTKTAVLVNKFSELTKDKLIEKVKENDKNKFWRYITKHKGRTIIIIIAIIILVLCFMFSIPTNGDQDTTSAINHIGSILGFFASNIFICILLTIIGVETYFSREELEQLKYELNNRTVEELNKLKNKDDNRIISKIKNIFNKHSGTKIIVDISPQDTLGGNIESTMSSSRNSSIQESTYIQDLDDLEKKILNLDINIQAKILQDISNTFQVI